jgi:hypothetical protein
MPPLVLLPEAVKTRFRMNQIVLPSVVSGQPANVGQFLAQSATGQAGSTPSRTTSSTSASFMTTAPAPTRVGGLASRPPGLVPSLRPMGTPLTVPPALFVSASNDLADVNFQRQVNDEFSSYIDGIVAAIGAAHGMWRAQAFLSDIVINGPTATGGRLCGPALDSLILARAPQAGLFGSAAACTRAIAAGIHNCWRQWQENVTVPRLPWYPSFAAFPGPQAPPTPNIPTPLFALSSPFVAKLTAPHDMKMEMTMALGAPGPYSAQLFDAVATAMATSMQMWLTAQMVTNVLGKGPIPVFGPPYVPVGPVVMGDNISAPGHLNT